MGKRSKKSIDRQVRREMKKIGVVMPTKKPVGQLNYSSKSSNLATTPKFDDFGNIL